MSASEISTKNWYTTFLLCVVFIGIFGAHQFYLGRWKMGILYLWLWPILLFTLWPRDIYYLWTGKMKDADGKTLHSYKSWHKNITEGLNKRAEELKEKSTLQREQAVKDMKVAKEEYQEIKGEMKEDIKEFKEENNRILEELKSDLRAIKKTDPDKPLLPVVETQADYDLLKSGDEFIEDGSKYKKP